MERMKQLKKVYVDSCSKHYFQVFNAFMNLGHTMILLHNVSISAIEILNSAYIQSFETFYFSCETLWCL
jgi:hypothetical protein